MWWADRRVAELAARQHGVVSVRQVQEIGLSEGSIRHRLRSGRLDPAMRGVYAVGHNRLTVEGRWMAAVLAHRPSAVLSHRSAGALLGILATGRERIEITEGGRRRARPGIQVHLGDLEPRDVIVHRGIPVTAPARTLVDLAGVVSPGRLRRALEQAEILRHSALPLPETNVSLQVAGRVHEVDCLWRDPAVVVELDGHATHRTRRQFEEDRERDRMLATAGLTVIRVTWRQIHERTQGLERDLRTLLRKPAGAPPAATPSDRSPSRGASY
jgi:very-short-patch-repair endonuclease